MNTLAPHQVRNSLPAKQILELTSPRLRQLLTGEPDNRTAIEAIATDPVALAEASAILAGLEREASAPAGPDGVVDVVGRRFAIYPQPERSGPEASAWWDDYIEVLAEVPKPVLEAAMVAWIRTAAEFMPKPGQLYGLTSGAHGKEGLACLRVRAAMRWTPPADTEATRAIATDPVISPEQRAEIRAMASSFAKQLPEPPKPKVKPTYAQTDERGVSPEMRALLATQRGEA